MKYNFSFAIIICVLLLRCADKGKPDYQADEEEIKNTLIDMWDAIERGDSERYARHVHPDFTQFGETDSVLQIGKEAEILSIKQWME